MSITPSKRALPSTVDARKLTGQGVLLTGYYGGEQLPRLSDAVVALPEPVSVELSFSLNEQHIRTVTGQVEATVTVACQRCMGDMDIFLQADVSLGLVWDEEGAARLSKDFEPWIVADESAPLSELVEDELLLVLPYISHHEDGECQGASSFSTGEVEEEQTPNPFQVLAKLKGNKQS